MSRARRLAESQSGAVTIPHFIRLDFEHPLTRCKGMSSPSPAAAPQAAVDTAAIHVHLSQAAAQLAVVPGMRMKCGRGLAEGIKER
jgi:hypothetical protein